MSRIRSIHPGIWTDEAFMSLSAYGRLLLMGIWTEAFDDGVFEWKPLTLKARIFPVDMVDVNDLLIELVNQNLIARLEAHPKRPGVIRNFQRYQRPKKPNSSGMLPDEWLEYVGAKAPPEPSDDDSSDAVPNQYGTSGEKSPQMEDGGWNSTSSLRSEAAARALDMDPSVLEKKLREAAGDKIQPHAGFVVGPILELLNSGCDLDLDVIPIIRAKSAALPRPARSWAYFVPAIQDAHANRVSAKSGVDGHRSQAPPRRHDMSMAEFMRKRLEQANDGNGAEHENGAGSNADLHFTAITARH